LDENKLFSPLEAFSPVDLKVSIQTNKEWPTRIYVHFSMQVREIGYSKFSKQLA